MSSADFVNGLLGVLLAYISTRSENLNRLHTEAQRRADGTAIAVEELLQSLESSFATVRQRLHDSRQGIETGTFAVEAIVTSQAINESQGPTLRKLEGDIREALERRLSDVRRPTWRRVRRQYMARTRGWFPAKGNVDVDTLLGWQFDVGSDGTGLASASTKCARGILRVVNQQLTAAIASSIQHLRSTSEAWEIGTSARDIEFSLEKFERTHDDSVRSFYAYVSAPSSSDLLREHGFVGFDESGEQAVRTESIDALNCLGFAAISRASESCKERLRLVRREDPEDLDRSLDEDEERSIEDGAFGDGYRDHVANRVNVVCQQRVDELVSGLSERVDRFVKDVGEERTRVVSLRARIWRARATLVGRFAVVAISLSGVLFAFFKLAPNQSALFWSMLSDRLFEAMLVGSLSTVLVLAFGYVVSGAKNENVRRALRPILLEKWASRTNRRRLALALKAHFDESYDQLVSDVDEMPLQVDQAIADGVVEWLKNHSDSYRQAEIELAELQRVIVGRCELFDEFISVVNQHLNEIPKELRDTADEIKRTAYALCSGATNML